MLKQSDWRWATLLTSLGLAVFAGGLWSGVAPAELSTEVLAWPRSPLAEASWYAVRVARLDGDESAPLAHQHFECSAPSGANESLDTDESGWGTLAGTPALEPRACHGDAGAFAIGAAPPAPIGQETLAPAHRARTHGAAVDLYLESAELAVDEPLLAWLDTRAPGLELLPDPGLTASVRATCASGVALELTAHYHVTGLHLAWQGQTPGVLEVAIPVSRGGPRLSVSRAADGAAFASVLSALGTPATQGWLGVFDAHGLLDAAIPGAEPWPLPRADVDMVVVARRTSFLDSATSTLPLPRTRDSVCERAHRLTEEHPAPQDPLPIADDARRARDRRALRAKRGRDIATAGLALAAVGLLLAAAQNRRSPRLLASLGVAAALLGVLGWLLYH